MLVLPKFKHYLCFTSAEHMLFYKVVFYAHPVKRGAITTQQSDTVFVQIHPRHFVKVKQKQQEFFSLHLIRKAS